MEKFKVKFADLKVGQKVWTKQDGEIKINNILNSIEPIEVYNGKIYRWYSKDGFFQDTDEYPSLYLSNPFEQNVSNQEENNELQTRSKNIQLAKDILNGYGFSVGNLWSVDDVLSVVECNKTEAHDILQNALTNEAVMEQIWSAIKDYAETNEFELKDDNEF